MPIELANEEITKPITQELPLVGLYDRYSTYPSRGLTPEKLSSILIEADQGDVYRQMELFEEMMEKDPRLLALFQARRLAVTSRGYKIIPASDDEEEVNIAQDVETMLGRIKGWMNAVNDMLDCVPKGFSVNEIFWKPVGDKYTIEKLVHHHPKKFRFGKISDLESDPEELRLVVDPRQVEKFRGFVDPSELNSATTDGISVDKNLNLRSRLVIAYCKARSGNPARASLLRTLAFMYIFKNYDVKWWIQFAEKQLGYIIGKYDPNQPDQMKLLKTAVQGLAYDASAVISNTSTIEFVEFLQKAASHEVYSDIKNMADEEYAVSILGHVGTAQGTPGKLGPDDMAKDVKRELVAADAHVIDEAITDDIVVPYIKFNYGERDKYSYYQTDMSEPLDLNEQIDVDLKIQQAGYPLTQKYFQETYGRPLPDPNDPEDKVLTPIQPAGTFAMKDGTIIGDSKKKILTKR